MGKIKSLTEVSMDLDYRDTIGIGAMRTIDSTIASKSNLSFSQKEED